MTDELIFTILAILIGAGIVTFTVAETGTRRYVFFGSAYVLSALAVFLWIAYAVLHFTAKYW